MGATPTWARKVRILVVDDHEVFVEVLATRLRGHPDVLSVDTASSLAAARRKVTDDRPDLVILDYQLSGESSLELLPELHRLDSPPEVLMLSGVREPGPVIASLAAGAQGWATKDAGLGPLIAATAEVLRGHMYLAPPTVKPVIQQLLTEARRVAPPPSFVDRLSPRELEVLRCLIDGMSRPEVAERLGVSVNTVRTHIQHLLRYTRRHSTLALVAEATRLGIRGISDPTPTDIPRQRPSSE